MPGTLKEHIVSKRAGHLHREPAGCKETLRFSHQAFRFLDDTLREGHIDSQLYSRLPKFFKRVGKAGCYLAACLGPRIIRSK